MTATGFTGGADQWLAKLGGLRDYVRQELVTAQLREETAARFGDRNPLRVLDVGAGQGTQALRLALTGHEVTCLEADPTMLAALRGRIAAGPPGVAARVAAVAGDGRDLDRLFPAGAFDLVLCHGVLMYQPDPAPLLAALTRALAPGGLLSLLVRNADALALRPGLAGDWAGALRAFDTDAYTNRLGLATRADHRAALGGRLAALGVPVTAWYGVRVLADQAPDGTPPPADPRERRALLAAEERAGRTDPYRAVAALLHLVGVKK